MAKIVCNIKYIVDSNITRYKSRLVAYGFIKVNGVNYEEIFILSICYNILYIFFAIIAKNNWKVHDIDIVTAFLAEKLDEVIYL